jgi:putative oxidoreductase
MITLGVFTRLVALVSAIEMLVAYFMVHLPNGFYPVLNGGELVVLFFAAFLVMIVQGAKKLSLEKAFLEKEIF